MEVILSGGAGAVGAFFNPLLVRGSFGSERINNVSWIHDLRVALRMARRAPDFTAIAVLTLALGIGANTSIFSLVNEAFLAAPTGIADPSGLVSLFAMDPRTGRLGPLSYPDFADLERESGRLFEQLAVMARAGADCRLPAGAVRYSGLVVTPRYFAAFRAPLALGRGLTEEDEYAAPGVVLGYQVWERDFQRDPGILGRTLILNAQPYVVVGVTGPGFRGGTLFEVDFWVPMAFLDRFRGMTDPGRDVSFLQGVGRLRPGLTLATANAQLETLNRRYQAAYREWNEDGRPARAIQLQDASGLRIPPSVRRPLSAFLTALFVVMTIVLLIACLNLANLLLARAAAREREISVRLSLGATRGRIVRQLWTEGLLLAAGGVGLAMIFAVWTAELLPAQVPPIDGMTLAIDLHPDWRVFAFTLSVAVAATALFALAPAWLITGRALSDGLRTAAHQLTPGRRAPWARGILLGSQAALSVVLLTAAGLFLRSLVNLQSVDPGFAIAGRAVIPVDVSRRPLPADARQAQLDRIQDAVAAWPAVESVDRVRLVPLAGNSWVMDIQIRGGAPPSGRPLLANFNAIGENYFSTLGVRLMRGRSFTRADRPGSLPVAIVNESFAARYLEPGEPLGQQIRSGNGDWLTVVGIAADTKYSSLGEDPFPLVLLLARQRADDSMHLLVSFRGQPEMEFARLRQALRATDPDLPLAGWMTLTEAAAPSLVPGRVAAAFAGGFGAVALMLTAVGLYGVMAVVVAQRRRELGIRLALGASPRRLRQSVLWQGLRVTLAGAAAGLLLSLGAARLIASQLYGVPASDPISAAAAVALLMIAAAAGCYPSAARAASTDPMQALRQE